MRWRLLLRRYIEGEVSAEARATYDVLVPHDVLSTLRRCQPSFTLGHQHDAREALSLILDKTGLDEACFKCGQAPVSNFVQHDEPEGHESNISSDKWLRHPRQEP